MKCGPKHSRSVACLALPLNGAIDIVSGLVEIEFLVAGQRTHRWWLTTAIGEVTPHYGN